MTLMRDWQRLLQQRKNLVGGDVERVMRSSHACRGPITAIQIEGDELVIVTKWSARMELGEDSCPMDGSVWTKDASEGADRTGYRLNRSAMGPPNDMGEGRIQFTYLNERVTIFPRGDRRLDPRRVHGL